MVHKVTRDAGCGRDNATLHPSQLSITRILYRTAVRQLSSILTKPRFRSQGHHHLRPEPRYLEESSLSRGFPHFHEPFAGALHSFIVVKFHQNPAVMFSSDNVCSVPLQNTPRKSVCSPDTTRAQRLHKIAVFQSFHSPVRFSTRIHLFDKYLAIVGFPLFLGDGRPQRSP